jgi:hypothetical protein
VSVSKTDENKGRRIVRVSLHKRAVDKLNWQDGDQIRLDVTPEGAIVLSRDNQHGKSLCKASGRSGRKYIRYAVIPEFYDVLPVGTGREVEIDGGRIAFCLKENAPGGRFHSPWPNAGRSGR